MVARSRHVSAGVGIAVIGSGTIGRLRAQIAHRHPSVDHLVVCDLDAGKAQALARDCEADGWSVDATELIAREEVDAVVVATTEDSHLLPALAALQAGKPLLVEKPLAILPEEGEKLIAEASSRGLPLYTGFTQRFRRRFLALKEHVSTGHIGQVTSAHASIYLAQSVGEAVISRAGTTTPAVNTLTYSIDLLLWYLGGTRPVTAYAQGGRGRFYDRYGVPDSTWAVLGFEEGTVANLGVSWELPEFWPAYVATMEMELFGRTGTVSVKDDHRDVLLASSLPIPSPYTPDVAMHVAMLGSAMPGDWALGEYFGAMKDETHAFINSVGTGRADPVLATGREGQDVLMVSRAIDESVSSGSVVTLGWDR
ncbi:MAG: Gfo/Idh/MocA family protein [Acidimicrobiales bacterium]